MRGRDVSMSAIAREYRRWEARQRKSNRQMKYVPGLRNMFLFFSFILMPAFIVYAYLDSRANTLDYTWLSVVAFLCMYLYGLIVIFDFGYRGNAAYLASGFIMIALSVKLIGSNPAYGQIIWGQVIGWFGGVASISCFMWLRLRQDWNERNPDKRC